MKQNMKIKLFISYSHQDETSYIQDFKKHITPLKDNGLIEEWYDRKILAGEDYQNKIDNNLEDADMICLFISANFLSSNNCKREKEKAMELIKKKVISVVPIILSSCGWQDDKDISRLLALPTDGKPISNAGTQKDKAWNNVYEGLKEVIIREQKIRQLEVTKEFEAFLQDTDMLTKAHPQKKTVLLDDIFVYPKLDKFNEIREFEKTIGFDELLQNINDYQKVTIAGENSSGKTTICKMLFKELRKRNLVPVYISDKNKFAGKMENKISEALKNQYQNINIDEIQENKERIVPIVDDFYTAKNKGKHLEYLRSYSYCILIVDDIFSINISDEALIAPFIYLRIKELKPSLRNELIKKWVTLSDKETDVDYKAIDQRTEEVDQILGKNISKGIIPAYPFFILSTIVTYETFAMPLNQEITSQGYCYQAFIYFYLRKEGAQDKEIDIYINFLTELSFYFYTKKKEKISPIDFKTFMDSYLEKFNLPIKQEILLKKIDPIVLTDSFNNYSFQYPYLYYFFVAKYLVEYIDQEKVKNEIERIINNLHIDENAYIAIFMAHHSKSVNILDEIELNVLVLFDKYKPATLTKDEVSFFDGQIDNIVKAHLPPPTTTPEKVREELLKKQDQIEQSQMASEENVEEFDPLEKDLRRSIRTVEVIGCIIKNRAGSLPKDKLEEMFTEAMDVHLRILSSFFEIIKNEEEQKCAIAFLLSILNKIIEKEEAENKKINVKSLEKIAKKVFWNINFFVVYGYINKIVKSLGSDKLIDITEKVCDKVNTPASFLVKHGILMWYKKNLQIDKISERMQEKDFSRIAERVLKSMVVNHCALHPLNYKDRQRIETLLKIQSNKLLMNTKYL